MIWNIWYIFHMCNKIIYRNDISAISKGSCSIKCNRDIIIHVFKVIWYALIYNKLISFHSCCIPHLIQTNIVFLEYEQTYWIQRKKSSICLLTFISSLSTILFDIYNLIIFLRELSQRALQVECYLQTVRASLSWYC